MCTCETDRQPQGAALVIVMLVMAVLLLAGTTFLTISSTETQIAENQRAAAHALVSAENALHGAVARLSADATYAGETSVSVGSGTASIGISLAAEQKCLSKDLDVVASVPVRGGLAQARIRATADQAIYPFQWGFFAANGPLILASLDASLGPWSSIDSYDSRLGAYHPLINGGGSANVGAWGSGVILTNVNLLGGAAGDWVTSTPTAVGNLGRPGESPVPLDEPSVTWSDDPNVEANGTLTLAAGTHHFTRITLGAGARVAASGPVTIYVRGDVEAGDDVVMGAEPGQKLHLVTNSGTGTPSTFRTGERFRFYGSLYGINTNVVFGDHALVHGSVIGRRISGPHSSWEGAPCCNQKAPTLHFDRAMTRREVCTHSSFSIRRGTWREVFP